MMSTLKNLGKSKPKRAVVHAGLMGKIIQAADRLAFSWPIRHALYKHLSGQVGNKVPVLVALEKFRTRLQRRGKVSSDKIVADAVRRMRDGQTLAGALGAWVPANESGIIASGELSGNLPESLDLIIEANQRVKRIQRAMKSAIFSPAVYAAAMYGLVAFMGHLTPEFEKTLPREKATGLVSGLYAAGAFTTSWWAFLPPLFAAAIVVTVVASLPRWTGRTRIKVEGTFPYSAYRDLNGYIWLMGFASLLKAGQPDTQILKRQMATATPWLKERLHLIWWRMDNGSGLGKALIEKGRNGMPALGFPNPDIVDDIESFAGFSDFPERIITVAREWAKELEETMLEKARNFGLIADMVMYAIMALFVASISALSDQMGSMPAM